MNRIADIALVVREYDEAIAFYVGVLGFSLLEDTDLGGGKRWVRVAPLDPSRDREGAGSQMASENPLADARGSDPALISSAGTWGPGDQATGGTALLLARAVTPEQAQRIGNQTGGRVFLFIHTDDFDLDYAALVAKGVEFVRGPIDEAYGRVAVFLDLYGNKIDLIGRAQEGPRG